MPKKKKIEVVKTQSSTTVTASTTFTTMTPIPPQYQICEKCNAVNPYGSIFCNKCGKKMI